ncbi:trihelix transcription factor GTL1 isoform X2 [Argentina anserina]|uniref:trihelix transcription factor GTL1 isoform X2 n=1 Tax=Argentina anserina TaxID=57926 RepID=UPI0021763355|nr:trihelix transcription factor GTL1 isoform X2 [Potentilla anserina]
MQQQQGGGTPQPHYRVVVPSSLPEAATTTTTTPAAAAAAPSMAVEAAADQAHVVEEASPISSRPPAGGAISAVNLDELMTLSGAAADVAADQGGGGGGSGGGNRWPRQETLALLKIRSEMDVAFRDATLKGPLWEDVSRKLAELGYKRNAKKCKEKFENVHKYYKRTKEGRAGRQDGKSYKFFSELEALHGTASSPTVSVSASPPVHVTAPVSIGFGGSISNPVPLSFRMTTTGNTSPVPVMPSQGQASIPVMPSSQPPPASTAAPMDIHFSSNSSSSSRGEDDDYEDDEGEPNTSRKRKRGTRESGGSTRRMMEFFEILMKQVMQKQETMQQRFLEVIEKREQDRNVREEAWKRHEMARLSREHELMAQERAISASRDAAIIAFLQKITGQTIQLPPPLNVHNGPPPSVSVHATPVSAPPPPQQQPHQHQQQQQTPTAHISRHQIQTSIPPSPQMDIVCVPDQQVAAPQDNVVSSGGGFEATTSSSRWPKAEVLALIKLRSGLETRYQEAGPKGPLWEEISAGMQRMGYKRNPKRCKEKWENINKYFKKVKESNKARPEDAKTCPYFHELDALYRKRILGGGPSGGSSSSLGNQIIQQQAPQQLKLDSTTQGTVANAPQLTQGTVAAAAADQSVNKSGDNSPNLQKNLFGDAPEEAAKKKTL